MSNDVVIRAEGLGKKYLIGHQAERERYTALRDVIARNARNFGRSVADMFSGRPNVAGDAVEEFWALKDVSFEIKRGDVVGVIGRNGAGKSTLLKVLSRITEPTEGRVEIRGRVASLLEVGTGFHPELTGRENIYLNGAILGMTRAEIKKHFDEIVAFAEVEKFLDTPVKRYSSGMYVRLAFAVAAHMQPEILIVDEVLAVGDAEFQKKCIGKMSDIATSEGRTVLFVSHNMTAIRNLCSKSLWLVGGTAQGFGPSDVIINTYLDTDSTEKEFAVADSERRQGSGAVRCTSVTIRDSDLNELSAVEPASPFYVDIGFTAKISVKSLAASLDIDAVDGGRLASLYSGFLNQSFDVPKGKGIIRCFVHGLNLTPDKYSLSVMLDNGSEWLDFVRGAKVLTISDTDFFGTGRMPTCNQGRILTKYRWSSSSDSQGFSGDSSNIVA